MRIAVLGSQGQLGRDLTPRLAGEILNVPRADGDWGDCDPAEPKNFRMRCSMLARRLGDPKAVRAVGTANGRNPISIVVPCHRVIGANGSLTGYAGGLWRKQALLKLEGHPDL